MTVTQAQSLIHKLRAAIEESDLRVELERRVLYMSELNRDTGWEE
jgi:hypothetical protein